MYSQKISVTYNFLANAKMYLHIYVLFKSSYHFNLLALQVRKLKIKIKSFSTYLKKYPDTEASRYTQLSTV